MKVEYKLCIIKSFVTFLTEQILFLNEFSVGLLVPD